MQNAKISRYSLFLAAPFLLLILSLRAANVPAQQEVAVVVNSANPVSNLSLSDLRKIYMGERLYWKANSAVVVLMRSPGAPERDIILRVVYGMSEERYTQYWVAKIMRAEASDPPAVVYSHGMVLEGVRGNPGAIGYVDSREVRPGTKVLRIDGLLPGEPGYPLH